MKLDFEETENKIEIEMCLYVHLRIEKPVWK